MLIVQCIFFTLVTISMMDVLAQEFQHVTAPLTYNLAMDISANDSVPMCSTRDNTTTYRNGLIDEKYRWKNFILQIEPAFTDLERRLIVVAMSSLQQFLPCVNFQIWPEDTVPSGDYIEIVRGLDNGCNSQLGRQGGRQIINLQSPGCMSVGTIMHEMIHALGFHHEHCRPDRDDYVDILWENIEPQHFNNFEKFDTTQATAYGVPYNYRSIMHYPTDGFSKNGQPTILSKTGETIGSDVLQQTDILKLKLMYDC